MIERPIDRITRPPVLSADDIRAEVAAKLGLPVTDIAPDDDLVVLGLDSLGVMTLATAWQDAGLNVTFGDLIEEATVEAWARLTSVGGAAAPAPPAAEPGQAFQLAPMQHAYWSSRRPNMPMRTGSHFYFEFDADLDPNRLDRAVRALRSRHPMVRAQIDGDGIQRVHPELRGLDEVMDLRGLDEDARQRRLSEIRARLSHQTLRIEDGRGLDVRLALITDGSCRLFVDIDMIVSDAGSFRILVSDLARLYSDDGLDARPLDLSYPEYLSLVERSARRRERDAEYWRERAESLPTAPALPLGTAPERLGEVVTVRRHTWLSGETRARLDRHARDHGVTLSLALATAYADVQAAWSDTPHFLLNLPVFNRLPVHPDVHRLVGDFTELLLLETRPDAGRPFAERARALQEQYRRDAAHSSYGGTSVLRDLARTTTGHAHRTGVVFTSALSMGELFEPPALELFGQPVWMSSQTPGVWIDLQVMERDGGVLINWETAENLFSEGVPAAMFTAFVERVRLLAEDPAAWSKKLPVPLPADQARVRAEVNATQCPVTPRLLHAPVFEQAVRAPERIAVIGEAASLTYGRLAEQALAVAGCLHAQGLRPGDPVAVSLPKGPEQIVAVLGVLAAGGCYVPIGTDQPPRRRDRITHAAGTRLALTAQPADWPGARTISLDAALAHTPLDAPAETSPHELAYIIFTSGSTGEPKGVEITHAAAANTIDDINSRYHVTADDAVLAVSALDFDLSVYDIFGLLAAGGRLVTITEDIRREATAWTRLVDQHQVTIWNTVPTLLDMLLTAAEDHQQLPALRLALVSGDWVGLDLHPRLGATAPHAHLVALGGATEASIWSNAHDVTHIDPAWTSIPYGRPLANQHYRVVDPHGHDRPDWVPGELWIGGTGLARGYRADPHRTSTAFPTTPDGHRYYRTGDQGRYHPDGTLEFLGRTDHQVKIRGHRIELGEVERALERVDGVREAVAVVLPELHHTLCALIVAHDGADAPREGVRDAAAEHLPEYMVPTHIEVAGTLPLNANGKVDRARVRADLAARVSAMADAKVSADAAPTGIEATLASIWAALLEVPSVTARSNFFHLGGDSLLATRMLAALRREGLSGHLGDLFRTPTVAGFAARLTRLDHSPGDDPRTIVADPAHRHDPFELTDVQRAYWLGRQEDLTLGGVGSWWYWEFEADSVDLGRLQAAWNGVVRRHEMMRAVLDDDGHQRILESVPEFRFKIRTTTADDHEEAVTELRRMDSQVRDVTRWPLYEVRAVQCEDGRTVLGIGFDYVVLDALSIVTVLAELSARYDDPDLELPELELSYRDYLLSTKVGADARQRDEEFWLRKLEELPAPPALPVRTEPEQVGRPRFVRREFRIGPERWQALRRRTAEYGLTASTVVATAFAEVLAAWSAEPALTLSLTVFDRQDLHPQVNEVVGDFTSLMLLGHESHPDEPWAQTVRRVHGQAWEGMEHSGVSAVWVLQQLAQRHGAAHMLMPVVFTSTLGVAGDFPDLELSFGTRTRGLSQTPQVTLDCQVIEQGGGLDVNWDYVDSLFAPGVVEAASDAMRGLLERLADHDWDRPLPRVALPADQARVRAEVNATQCPVTPRLLHAPVFEQAVRAPDRIAVIGEAASLTYGRLAEQALAVAGCLHAGGLRPGDPVAVCLPKGPEQIVAVLGVLAAGGCYVPIGTDQPPRRRDRITHSAGARLALTAESVDWAGARTISLDTALAHTPLDAPAETSPDELAYIIFTSGSTGEPKGVEITHAAAANTVDDINSRYHVTADDAVLAVSALDFDLSVYDIFGLLAAGGRLVTITEDTRREATAWTRLVDQHHVTIWNTVPTLLDMLLTAAEDHQQLPALRLALVSGDWVGLDLHPRLGATAPRAHLVALGGATEASIWSNAHDVTHIDPAWTSIPYGRPLANQHYRVVDPHGHDRPDWVPGELWIGGTGLARGYRADPHRTSTAFPTTPDGHRYYRTGDQGRYHPDGTLEFLGRTDHQVKIRGHRIELGEIETRLRELDGITHAVAWVERTGPVRRLVAAVTGADPDPEAVRAWLAEAVPGYMVPEHVRVLDEMPLTPNGKVDRAALARTTAPVTDSPAPFTAPRSATERAVAAVWQELLGMDEISRDAGFFELGGDSLTAIRVAQRLDRRFGVQLTLRQLFDRPTLSQVAALIDELALPAGDHDAPIRLEEGVL
ncbi:amino acid adenylation domain-containing protein [Streptomyces sp. NPDC002784]